MRSAQSAVVSAREPALPSAYAPFLPLLAQLAQPLRSIVGGQLVQFERLREQFAPYDVHRSGELEGFDGLALKGDLSHILQSELLLRTEAPMEFLRRLSESEALFVNKSFVDPGAHTAYRLVISCGPNLLGHARLTALSALFFFARLADGRASKFYWSFAPRNDGPIWFEGLTPASLRTLMAATSFREIDARDIEALAAAKEAGADSSRDVDWVLVADAPENAEINVRAPRALCVRMLPPVRGEPRRAGVSIVRGGRVRGRFAIAFPEDEHCLSALRDPFAPRASPTVRRQQASGRRRPMLHGWEPLHFVSPRQDHFMVRMSSGLLVLCPEAGARAEPRFRSYWVEIPDHLKLVGAELVAGVCHVALQGAIEGQDAIWIGAANLAVQSNTIHAKMWLERRFPCRQLFLKQAPFALPGLDIGRGHQATIYSSLGQSFRGGGAFELEARAGRIVFDNGVHRAFWEATQSEKKLRLEKRGGRLLGVHAIAGDDIDPRALLGAIFDHNGKLFCYSAEPGAWTVVTQGHEAQRIQLSVADQVVAIRSKSGALELRVWSDARYGGDGSVRLEDYRDGEVLSSRAHFNFAQVGGIVGKYEVTSDGRAWAVVLDEGDDPISLVRCRRKDGAREYAFHKYDLEELRADACRLDLRSRFD